MSVKHTKWASDSNVAITLPDSVNTNRHKGLWELCEETTTVTDHHLANTTSSIPEEVEPVSPLAGSTFVDDVVQQVIHRHVKHLRWTQLCRQRHILQSMSQHFPRTGFYSFKCNSNIYIQEQ